MVKGRDNAYSLIVKPIFHGNGVGRGATLNVCDTTRIHDHPKQEVVL